MTFTAIRPVVGRGNGRGSHEYIDAPQPYGTSAAMVLSTATTVSYSP
jgi:hypothetical protein